MRLMLHTLKKDVRRLWPAAAVTWVMLAVLANADRWRADWIPSPMEGWMNLLVTMAWIMLVALAVLEEPLVGDRNFWTTRPHSWPALLVAKLVFVVLAIHLPSLLADFFVLAARGFSPAIHLGDLFWKQVLFFGAVTIPSIALASLVRNFTQFVIAGFVIAVGIAILNGGFGSFPEFRRHESEVRHAAVRILLATAALAVMWTQYARRRVVPARMMAVVAALAAASLSAWLPRRIEYAVRSGRSRETPSIALRNAPTDDASIRGGVGDKQRTVMLPIAIARTHGNLFRMPIVEVEIAGPDGTRIHSILPSPNRPFEKIDLAAYSAAVSRDRPPEWLALRFSAPAWERVKNARVHVRGTAAFEFYRRGETAILPALGRANVPDVGRCTALTVDDRFSEGMLKVLCESPRELPAASITLRHEASGREWRDGLNSGFTYSPGPHETWLSPLHRGQSFFRLANSAVFVPGSKWLVPVSYVSSARIEITPEIVTGHALASFDLGEVALALWLVPR